MAGHLGADVPLHFTAFHPDWKMTDHPPTPPSTLARARRIALSKGLHHVYTGNVRDPDGGSTYCPQCHARVIERDGYRIGAYRVTEPGACRACGARIAGIFDGPAGSWGSRRMAVRLAAVR